MSKAAFLFSLALLAAAPAYANESVTYTYDALGRVTNTSHAGSVNNNIQQTYSNDLADNRSNVTVTGSTYVPVKVIVVPLAGITVIPISTSY